MEVQIFGRKKSQDTRAALRFFSERRIKVHFVDIDVRGPSPGELRRFVERFGAEALVDRDGRRFAELGLAPARYSADHWASRLLEEPTLLRLPLVRWQQRLTIGREEATWRDWHRIQQSDDK
jgi:arsenate reductase-like glutaredoxin family protein